MFSFLQIFLCDGKFIFGPDVRSLGLTILLIVVPITIFCIYVAKKLMDDYPDHWGISIMVAAVLFTVYVRILYHLLITCSSRTFSCL